MLEIAQLPDYIRLLAELTVLTLAVIGWGNLALFLLPKRVDAGGAGPNLFDAGVAGLAALYVLAVVLSLALPFNAVIGDGIVLAGLIGYAYAVRLRRGEGGSWRTRWVMLLSLAAYAAWGTALTPLHYDTGLYHLQVIQWFQTEPLPLGLANLHTRFGYNSAWFAIAAVVGKSRLLPDAAFLLNGVVSVLVCGALLESGWERIRSRNITFGAVLAITCVVTYLGSASQSLFTWMGLSPTTDVPAALLTIYAIVLLSDLVETGSGKTLTDPDPTWRLWLCAVAGCLAVAVKLSQFPVMLALMAAVYHLRLMDRGTAWRMAIARTAGAVVVIAGLWVVHALMLSGCLLFPYGSTCLAWIPWSVNPEDANHLAHMLKMWARAPLVDPGEVPGGLGWIPLWIENMWPDRAVLRWILGASALLTLAALALRILSRGKSGFISSAGFRWSLGVSLAGLAVCVATAPDPRYYLGFLLVLPCSLTARFLLSPWVAWDVRARWVPVAAIAVILSGLTWWNVRRVLLVTPKELPLHYWRHLPEPAYHVVETSSGFQVKTPDTGDQCWGLPAPCSPADMIHQDLQAGRALGRTVMTR